jgi:catechol 2,3-dioxygenase-like lactoylglutathione lyase family enzyme
MDYDKVSGPELGHALRAISVNLLCRDVMAEVAFLTTVFGMTAHQAGRDFAIVLHAGQPLQLHSDGAFAGHPLIGLLPEAGARGAGAEIRLHEADPDVAAARAEGAGGIVLQVPADKKGHALREAVILSPAGYAYVPSRRI